MDQLQTDYQLRAVLEDVQDLIAGTEYLLYGQKYKYMGTDVIHKQSMTLMRDHPEMFNAQVALGMMRDPLGYRPPPFQLSPNVVAGIAAAAAVGKLADLTGIGDAVKDLVPGLDAGLEAMKGQIGGLVDKLPIKLLGPGSIAIPGQIMAVKAAMDAALKGPTSAIAMAMKGSLLADVAAAASTAVSAAGAAVNLASQVGGLAKAMGSGNPIAMASAAAGIASQFPMINPNAIAGQMISGALSGAGFDIASKIPNMSMVGGLMKMLPIPGKLPTKDAKAPVETPAPPKPLKPVELKNLFAEGAAAGGISDLMKPLSQAMGIAATIASVAGIAAKVASSPTATSLGLQKLTGNANTYNWGSGGYGAPPKVDLLTLRRTTLTSQIERHTKELDVMCATPYKILYSMPYPELVRKYPALRPNTPVAQALQIIASVNAGLQLANIVFDFASDNGRTTNFASGGIVDSGAASSPTGTTPVLLEDAYKELRPTTNAIGEIPQPTRPDRGPVVPNPQTPYDSSIGMDGEMGNASNYASGNANAIKYDPSLGLEYGQDPLQWNDKTEEKITNNAMNGYDYTQQGSNDLTDPSLSTDNTTMPEQQSYSAADGYDSYSGTESGYDYGQQGSNDVGGDYG
jgi:hypothetical protein